MALKKNKPEIYNWFEIKVKSDLAPYPEFGRVFFLVITLTFSTF